MFYTFDDDNDMKIGITSEKNQFAFIDDNMNVHHTNNVCISLKRSEAFAMSEYFLVLSKELNKLRELG